MDDNMSKLYTCVICYNLFDEATALNTCRHIFCWKCIHGKITEHNWHCCPICYVEFGPDPLIRLRHDDPLLLTLERNNPIEDEEAESEEEDMETDYEESSEDEETETDDEDSDEDDMEAEKTDKEDMEAEKTDEEDKKADEEEMKTESDN